jgi:hypothetical protein
VGSAWGGEAAGSVVPASAVFRGVAVFTLLFPLLAHLGTMLVDLQPALELLGPALFLGCRVAFALLRQLITP